MKKIPGGYEFTPGMAKEMAEQRYKQEVCMVIDLTNSTRYYDPKDLMELGLFYVKIRCRGRGQAPEPEAVNRFCWEVACCKNQCPTGLIIVHCTHGFNRTGYMIVNYLMRSSKSSLEKNFLASALERFSRVRPPGIYKDHYINDLFKYYHVRRPSSIQTPNVPSWKGGESPDASPEHEAADDQDLEKPNEDWQHDDPIGEEIHEDQVRCLRMASIFFCKGVQDGGSNLFFPGSQPVSLDSQNMCLLEARRYYVTWKADGSRYMMLICSDGAYLINRAFAITRVQLRFPTDKGTPHHMTLLDGEMVVDEDMATGVRMRRFLVYDMMACNGTAVVNKEFSVRFKMIADEIIKPRNNEKARAASGKLHYDYSKEIFSIRRKDFWQLQTTPKLLRDIIPTMSHESDGLIFQSWTDPYKPGTCHELLKWKYASHNSVDFIFQEGDPSLFLMRRKTLVPLEGARVVFPDDEDPASYYNKIIECRYNQEDGVWEFMRERREKDTPNAYHVYEKVLKSIRDNITEDALVDFINKTIEESQPYEAEREHMRRKKSMST